MISQVNGRNDKQKDLFLKKDVSKKIVILRET